MELAKRFWSKVKIGNSEECWPWQGTKTPEGYGQFLLDGKMRYAHRVSFLLFTGAWAENYTLHDCDNPPCCNPLHLYDGTQRENIRQAEERGRNKPR
jgi:hypothetical protein